MRAGYKIQRQGQPGAKAGRRERGWSGGNVGLTDRINPNPGPPHYLRQYKQKVLFIHSGFGLVLFRFALG